jgi:glutathione synthase
MLVGSPADLDLSHALYSNHLVSFGHDVRIGVVNGLSALGAEFRCPMGDVTTELVPYQPFPGELSMRSFADVDLVWLLNQPHPRIAVDVWQLLWRLDQQVPFVNDVTGLMMLNNKNNLPLLVPPDALPPTLVTNDFGEAWGRYTSDPDGRWVLKPPNAGCGADVFVLEPGATNNRALLQSMTGNAEAGGWVHRGGLEGLRATYCVMQEFVPHREEKRVAIVGGRPVTQQVKRIADGEHRGNLSQGAKATIAELTDEERVLCERLGDRLMHYGIRFAGIDLAYPAIFEVNLVNPGGIVDPVLIGLPDTSAPFVEQIVAAVPGLGAGVAA